MRRAPIRRGAAAPARQARRRTTPRRPVWRAAPTCVGMPPAAAALRRRAGPAWRAAGGRATARPLRPAPARTCGRRGRWWTIDGSPPRNRLRAAPPWHVFHALAMIRTHTRSAMCRVARKKPPGTLGGSAARALTCQQRQRPGGGVRLATLRVQRPQLQQSSQRRAMLLLLLLLLGEGRGRVALLMQHVLQVLRAAGVHWHRLLLQRPHRRRRRRVLRVAARCRHARHG